MAKKTQPIVEDDFVNDSERPYNDMSRNPAQGVGGLLDQYLRPVVLIPSFLLGVALLALLYYLGIFQVIAVLIVAILLLLLGTIIIAYLDNSLTAESADLFTRIDLRDWRSVRTALNQAQQKQKDDAINSTKQDENDDDDIFANGLSPHFGGSTPQQQLEENLEDAKLQIVNIALQTMKSDVVNHIDNQRRNANIQLILAIVIGLVGVCVLVAASLNTAEVYYFSVTQCGMAIIVAGFVLLFLTQYSSTQQRIKFFQNELTNLNARIAAFQLAYLLEEKEAVNEIIRDLTRTERNFKLGKNDQLP